MFWQRARFALLAGVVASLAAATARAGDCCAPCTTKVCCTEWVPEKYETTRTVYKTEYKQEAYTAYKCECYPEVCTRQVTCYKSVPEYKTITVNYNVCVPVVEEKTIMQPCWTCQPVTKVVKKCVDQGHYECHEECCPPSCWEKMRAHFRHDCCEPCCHTKTVKVWVPCKVWVECPVTVMEKVCTYKPVVVKCCSYKSECRTKEVTTCCYRCVPEVKTEQYTVMKTRSVPVQMTRCVAVCVPVEEKVTCCRMVAKTVIKEVPCCTSCCSPCCK
jgi:hypothetical protein